VALVSDAGLPGISDPGARLVAAALGEGVPVTVLPGASAVDTALVASGFPAERYQFVGFLPRGARALARFWEELAGWPYPVVAFESPQRLPATLRSLADAGPGREVAVCRELTKRFEEVVRGSAEEVAARFPEVPKGEITLVLGGGAPKEDSTEAVAAVAELVEAGLPRRRAADLVARLTGASRNELYRRTL
jgi:16S rRNA (cytidine1402-2'-O)-methyltransferase